MRSLSSGELDIRARTEASQNGKLNPGGRFIPPATSLICLRPASAILLTASLIAAATRSSAISGSSANSLRSMFTRRTSWRPFITTLTMPPPDWPVTSSFASSSCARLRFSCMRCACCMSCAMGPRIVVSLFPIRVERFHRRRHDARVEIAQQVADRGVLADGTLGGALAHRAIARRSIGGRLERGGFLEPHLDRPAQHTAELILHDVDERGRTQMLELGLEREAHEVALDADQRRVA